MRDKPKGGMRQKPKKRRYPDDKKDALSVEKMAKTSSHK